VIQERRIDRSCCHILASRDTRDGVTTDLLRELTPLLYSLVHNAIVLTIHALGSLALAFLTEIHDRLLRSIDGVDLDLVVGVLDDGGGHGWCPLLMNIV